MTTKPPFKAALFIPEAKERNILNEKGIVRIPLDVPWPIEPVNVYVVKAPVPALIDTGLRYLDNMALLEQGLATAGLVIEDLKEIWLTHPHIDHFGLTHDLVARSGAKVMAFAATKPRFENYMEHWNADRAWGLHAFAASGVPAPLLEKLSRIPSSYEEMGGHVSVDESFKDGDIVSLGGKKVEIVHVPGHSPWCSAFWFHNEHCLVSGDALLERITSNPLLYPPDVGEPSWQGLTAYRASLQRIAAIPAEWVLPGHGRSFQDHQTAVQRGLDAQRRRQERIIDVMKKGVVSPYQIASMLFGEKRMKVSIFLAMSEVLRQLDWLVAEKKAIFEQTDSLWQYCLS